MAVYESSELMRGHEILLARTSVVGGMLRALGDAGAEPIPLLYASASSHGKPIHITISFRRDKEQLGCCWT
jgi:hypothetical protein